MFDAADTPTFLVEHQVVDHAAEGQFRVFFDGIVLQVFVPAIAVHQIFPVRITRADAAAERQAHGRALDIERLVVLEHANRFGDVDV